MSRKKIDRHRGTCETCGQENICHTAAGFPYSRHLRSPRHRAAAQLESVADKILTDRFIPGRYERVRQKVYLFARVGNIGYFAVVKDGILGDLDRDAFRAIAAEAKDAGIEGPFHVYARICTYAGPSLHVYQPNAA